ncbi:autotransporter outer membrane beta-barrel domain-containing protein [Yersinia canariae]|nr:autotransporter outer membrane beta-barrel domain-containing protein [Yersinia canariae]
MTIFLNALLIAVAPVHADTIIDGGDIVTVPDTQPLPWDVIGNLQVGNTGVGELNIIDNGSVNTNGSAILGNQLGGSGTATISGPNATWMHGNEQIIIGYAGTGVLNITNGGTLSSGTGGGNLFNSIGADAGSYGTVNVSGAGSKWMNDTRAFFGVSGTGELNITDGGVVSNRDGYLGDFVGSLGTATISGAGSTWFNDGVTVVSLRGTGILNILDGGVVSNTGNGYIGGQVEGTGTVNVSGTDSSWINASNLFVGFRNIGALNIFNSAKVSNINASVGTGVGTTGTVTVSGADSQWNSSGILDLGDEGSGTLTITDGGAVSASSLVIAKMAGSIGTLDIGSAAGEVASAAGTLDAASITFGDGSGQINFNHTDTSGLYTFAPAISGVGNINVYSGITVMSGLSDYSGSTVIHGGTLAAGAVGAFSANGNYVTETGGTLDLRGYSQTMGSLDHSGQLDFGSVPGTILTVAGNYTGNNGLLNFNTLLHDDTSVTDKLVVEGNTAGTTLVSVNNAGGSGAQTLNGIELITVAGNSAGEFTQSGRIVAGAYDYYLERGIGGNQSNWYLNNSMPTDIPGPGVPGEPSPVVIERPEASGYSANLAAANNMFVTRLHDRLGETHYIDVLTGERKVTSLWLRNEGGHNRSRDTQDQLRTQSNRYVMQLGGDIAQWSHNGADRFHLGVMAGYGNSKSTTESRLSGYSARASVDGYSTGVYGTWYANSADKTGLYVDSWAQYSWFNNTVNGQDLAVEKYKSKGVTASVESGYTFKVVENAAKNASYFIQLKAQVTWMGVKADDHKEANGTNVSGEGDGNIQTRLGVKAFMNGYADQDKGKDRVFQPFVEANWIHNTKDFGTTMDGMTVKQAGAANIGELKLGVEGQINKNVNLWGNVGQQVGNKGYSDTAVMLGVKYNF